MKTKKITKKLSLSKATVSNLEQKALNEVRGGVDTYGLYCSQLECSQDGACTNHCSFVPSCPNMICW
jgi:hypothetical protein